MLHVTWEWLGQAPALDLADTVAIVEGAEHDLIASGEDFDRWAGVEASFLPEGSARLLRDGRTSLLRLRAPIRTVLGAVSAGDTPPRSSVLELNAASRAAPEWLELDPRGLEARTASDARLLERVLARYARSAIELVATEAGRLRRCPAPSCGMFYVRTRAAQRWCSTQCGTRARVARHYSGRRSGGPR